jgi:hypothetical protein
MGKNKRSNSGSFRFQRKKKKFAKKKATKGDGINMIITVNRGKRNILLATHNQMRGFDARRKGRDAENRVAAYLTRHSIRYRQSVLVRDGTDKEFEEDFVVYENGKTVMKIEVKKCDINPQDVKKIASKTEELVAQQHRYLRMTPKDVDVFLFITGLASDALIASVRQIFSDSVRKPIVTSDLERLLEHFRTQTCRQH